MGASSEQVLSIMHAHVQTLDRQKAFSQTLWEQQRTQWKFTIQSLERLLGDLQRVKAKLPPDDAEAIQAEETSRKLYAQLLELRAACNSSGKDADHLRRATVYASTEEQLPPQMVSSMTSKTMAAEKFLEEMDWKRAEEVKARHAIQKASRTKAAIPFQGQGYQLPGQSDNPADMTKSASRASRASMTKTASQTSAAALPPEVPLPPPVQAPPAEPVRQMNSHSGAKPHRCADLFRHLPISCCSAE